MVNVACLFPFVFFKYIQSKFSSYLFGFMAGDLICIVASKLTESGLNV